MNIAIITAGGMGSRMGDTVVPKQFLCVKAKPIIVYTIEHFQKNTNIDAIVVVCVSEYINYLLELKEKYQLSKISEYNII